MTHLLPAPKHHSLKLRLWLFALAVSMLASLFLGQIHAVKHNRSGAGYPSVAAPEALQDHGFFKQLFSNHLEGAECRLYDQLGDGHALPVVVAMFIPVVLPSALVAGFASEALARWAALFDARGPPLTF